MDIPQGVESWERFVQENKKSTIAVQYWLNENKENMKPHEARAFCRFELNNGMEITLPIDQMVNIKSTKWGGENGDITTIYGGYS